MCGNVSYREQWINCDSLVETENERLTYFKNASLFKFKLKFFIGTYTFYKNGDDPMNNTRLIISLDKTEYVIIMNNNNNKLLSFKIEQQYADISSFHISVISNNISSLIEISVIHTPINYGTFHCLSETQWSCKVWYSLH